jgi:hypothetical protein
VVVHVNLPEKKISNKNSSRETSKIIKSMAPDALKIPIATRIATRKPMMKNAIQM